VPLLLLAYLAASLAGGVAFDAIVAIGDGGGGSPLVLAIFPVFVAAFGATVVPEVNRMEATASGLTSAGGSDSSRAAPGGGTRPAVRSTH